MNPEAPSIEDLRHWLSERLRAELNLGDTPLDPHRPFDSYGLDSLSATVIVGDLEDALGRSLPGTLLYENPTLEALARRLAAPLAEVPTEVALAPAQDQEDAEATSDTGREGGLLGLVTGGARLPLAERAACFAAFRASLPAASYLRVVGSAADRTVMVHDGVGSAPRRMVMFGSNNYLGLATHPQVLAAAHAALDQYGVGLAGPAVLNGTTPVHRALEERLAAWKHAEDALVFPTGYAANVGALSALAVRGDTVLIDAYAHASIVDGLRMSAARTIAFAHNDMDALEALLRGRSRAQDTFVVVEGVYSMDGDLAPVDRLVPLCKAYGATLVVDDAHGTGVVGPGGRGTVAHFGMSGQVPVQIGTFSKSFGAVGGYVAASKPVIDMLRFLARSSTFSAALPPTIAAAVLAGIEVLEAEPWRVERLRDNVRYAAEGLRRIGVPVEPQAAVLALLAPPGMDIRRAAEAFHAAGVFVNPVEYPAVAMDKQRLRASISTLHERDDLDHLIDTAERVWNAHRHQ